jgi:hypothetical protein
MNFKNLIVILSCMALACMVMAHVSAGDVHYSEESENITFEGIDFTIPQGFGESKDMEDFDDMGSEGKTCFYINEYNGEIVITVFSDWMGMSLEELEKENATKTSINGHKGWNYTENGLHYFAYIKDDKGVLVGVTNETRLLEVVHS